tara:strand:+ start:151 stop:321 length:171 start_codon:yes stop_codon:yes gene_type:complete
MMRSGECTETSEYPEGGVRCVALSTNISNCENIFSKIAFLYLFRRKSIKEFDKGVR